MVAAALGCGLLVIVAVAGFLWRVATERQHLDVMTGFGSDVYLTDDPAQVRDVTSTVCTRRVVCNQAAQSPRVRILRFSSSTAARAHAASLAPYGWPSDHFVVQFLQPQTMRASDYVLVESIVDNVDTGSPD